MSIALSIADLAEDHAQRAGAERIRAIELDIGLLSGVEVDALGFAMEIAFRDTLLSGAEVTVNRIGAECRCRDCHRSFSSGTGNFNCPGCGSMNTRITRGMEMQLKSITVED